MSVNWTTLEAAVMSIVWTMSGAAVVSFLLAFAIQSRVQKRVMSAIVRRLARCAARRTLIARACGSENWFGLLRIAESNPATSTNAPWFCWITTSRQAR